LGVGKPISDEVDKGGELGLVDQDLALYHVGCLPPEKLLGLAHLERYLLGPKAGVYCDRLPGPLVPVRA
jgi:hypothetical protein